MSAKTYLAILKSGVLVSFFCVLLVFKNLLFPYISSKHLPFNVLVEILAVFWLAFVIKYPDYNPFQGLLAKKPKEGEAALPLKKTNNLITFSLIAFALAMIASLFVSVDLHMSIWSNVERQLGLFQIFHFFFLYIIIITVFRDWRDWQTFFTTIVFLAFLVAVYRSSSLSSTIGNGAYVATFMLFSFYFIFLIFFNKNNGQKKYFNIFYIFYLLLLPFLLAKFKAVNTTGAYVGLGLGALFFAFLYGIVNKRRFARLAAWGILIVLVAGLFFAFNNRSNPIVKKIPGFNEISFKKITFQTRLISWRGAYKDFPNHWLLGTGHGNYSGIFDRNFKATFYDYTRAETYFDRAHNNIIDIASTTGVVGILAYLSIFVAIGIYLIKSYRRGRLPAFDFCLLSSLVLAYFIQNLVIFDSFVTYLCFMALLGYIHWQANSVKNDGKVSGVEFLPLLIAPFFLVDNLILPAAIFMMLSAGCAWFIIFFFNQSSQGEEAKNLLSVSGAKVERGLIDKEIYALFGMGIVAIFCIYQFNVLPYQMMVKAIGGQMAFNKQDVVAAYNIYREAFAKNTILDRDGRSMFLRSLSGQGQLLERLDQKKAEEIMAFAVEQAEKNLAYDHKDSLIVMEAARAYDLASRFATDKNKAADYSAKALKAINEAIALSPERIPVYFIKAQFLVGQGKIDEAIATLEEAAPLNKNFYETYCQLSQIYLLKSNGKSSSEYQEVEKKGYAALDVCLNNGGADMLVIGQVVSNAINHYIKTGEINKVIQLYEQLINFDNKNADIWFNLARLYREVGQKEKAIAAAQEAAKVDKNRAKDVKEFIDLLNK